MFRKTVIGLLAAVALFVSAQAASAACAATTCFWIGTVNANWNQIGNWSDTSGGLTNGSTITTGDRLCFDSAGNTASTANASVSIASINTAGTCTGGSGSPHTAGITQSAGVTLTNTGNDAGANGGTCHLIAATSPWTAANTTTSILSFTGTSGTCTITQNSSGANRNVGNVTINGAGEIFKLGSDIIAAAGSTITSTAHTDFQWNGFNISTGTFDCSNAANTRTITPGAGTLTITIVSSTGLNCTNNAVLTFTGANVTFAATATGQRLPALGGRTWGRFEVANPTFNAQPFNFNSSLGNTFTNLIFTNVANVLIPGATTQTIAAGGTLVYSNVDETATGILTTANGGTGGTISLGAAATATLGFLNISNIIKAGAGSNPTCTSCFKGGSVTNINFTAPGGTGGPRQLIE